MSAAPELGQSFKGWLYRPYLDLGPLPPQPAFQVTALDYDYRAVTQDIRLPRLQSSANASFKEALITTTGLFRYDVSDPRELPQELRTQRWNTLCQFVADFPDLDAAHQVRLGWLLSNLCFYPLVLRMIPQDVEQRVGEHPDTASLAYLRSWCRYRMWLDGVDTGYSLAEFQRIAENAPPGYAAVDAHYQMVAQNAKRLRDAGACEHWQPLHAKSLERASAELSDFETGLLRSRYHRAGGFLPQLRGDRAGVISEMARAEEIARSLDRSTQTLADAADEMLYPCVQSRMQEAIWLGETTLALERADEYIAMAPTDPRGWLHKGEILIGADELEGALHCFRRAARYAPPGEEVALFMAGQCLEAAGDIESAFDAYLGALRIDPMGTSTVEALAGLAESVGHKAVLDWLHGLPGYLEPAERTDDE